MKLDNFEQGIEGDISSYKKMSPGHKKKINQIIKTSKEKKSINLRVNKQDLNLLKH